MPLETPPLRIFVGTTETAGFTYDLGDGFTRLGHSVTTALSAIVEHFHDQTYDMDIGDDVAAVSWKDIVARISSPDFKPPRRVTARSSPLDRMLWLIARHDVFVFMYTSLWPDRLGKPFVRGIGRDYALLKTLGKKIVTFFIGPEGRHHDAYDQCNAWYGFDSPPIGTIVPSWAGDPVARPLRNLRRAEMYSDVIFSQPNQAALAVRPYMHLNAPIDLSKIKCRIPRREIPVVVHAPSDNAFKGTATILAALDRLRGEGMLFELRLLQGVPNARVVRELQNADVAIDQLHAPLHGRFGVEAMAAGCALATANHERIEPVPARRPIWHIDATHACDQLRELLASRALRVRLARKARRHVERYHDHVTVARQLLEHIDPAGIKRYDHYPSFFVRHYRLAERERIPRVLQRMTSRIVQRWGLPDDVSIHALMQRGMLSAEALDPHAPLPRWPGDP